MHHLLPLLELALRALHELGRGAHGVVVAGPGEGAPEDGDPAGGLVDGDHVPGLHLLLGEGLDHLLAQVVDGLHLRGLERQLPRLAPRRGTGRWAVDLNLHHLALDDLGLLLDAHTDGAAEGLRQRLGFVHL